MNFKVDFDLDLILIDLIEFSFYFCIVNYLVYIIVSEVLF